MIVTGHMRDLARRILVAVLTLTLALGVVASLAGCSKAQDAVEQKQDEAAEQFEEGTTGNAEKAEGAVDQLNQQIDTTEENAQ